MIKELIKEELDTEKKFFDPGWFGPESIDFYMLKDESAPARDNLNPNSIISAYIELKGTATVRSRAIYNALDLLGDVGGLFNALKLIAQALMYLIGQGGLSAFLVGKLFYYPLSDTFKQSHLTSSL